MQTHCKDVVASTSADPAGEICVSLVSAVLHVGSTRQCGFFDHSGACPYQVRLFGLSIYRRAQWCGLQSFMHSINPRSLFCNTSGFIVIVALVVCAYFPSIATAMVSVEAGMLLRTCLLQRVASHVCKQRSEELADIALDHQTAMLRLRSK